MLTKVKPSLLRRLSENAEPDARSLFAYIRCAAEKIITRLTRKKYLAFVSTTSSQRLAWQLATKIKNERAWLRSSDHGYAVASIEPQELSLAFSLASKLAGALHEFVEAHQESGLSLHYAEISAAEKATLNSLAVLAREYANVAMLKRTGLSSRRGRPEQSRLRERAKAKANEIVASLLPPIDPARPSSRVARKGHGARQSRLRRERKTLQHEIVALLTKKIAKIPE